ncbi:MAG: alginate export family protein [Spirochaetales bacterium]|nr:alginate export family protein [Spirochaetales bacterium]
MEFRNCLLLLCFPALLLAQSPADAPSPEKEPAPAEVEAKPVPPAPALAPERPLPDLRWLEGMRWYGLVRFRPEARTNAAFDRVNESTVFTGSVCTVKRSAGKTCTESGGKQSSTLPAKAPQPGRSEMVGQKIQLGVEKSLSEDTRLVVLLQDARVWGGTAGSANGLGTANSRTEENTDLREAYLASKNLIGPVGLIAGRQILSYGDQRLVGGLEWTGVGRSFDGFRLTFENKAVKSHLWGSVIAEDKNHYSAITDGNESSATLKDGYFAGWYNTIQLGNLALVDLYYLGVFKQYVQKSEPLVTYPNPASAAAGTVNADSPKLVTDQYGLAIASRDRQSQRDQLHTVGLRLTNKTSDGKAAGALDWTIEGARQFGRSGVEKSPDFYDILFEDDEYTVRDPAGNTIYALKSDPEGGYYRSALKAHQFLTKKEEYAGYALSVDTGFTVQKIRIGVEAQNGSGDENPNDFRSRTFNNLFPTNHLHYGYADLLSWQNMQAASINVSLPLGGGQLRLAYWKAEKDQSADAWYNATGGRHSVSTTAAATEYAEPTGSVQQSREKRIAKRILKRKLWERFQEKALFDEIDLTYKKVHKAIEWELGYSYIQGGSSIRRVKDDPGYALASRYLDQFLYDEDLSTVSSKIASGDFVARPPTFRSVMQFAYLMMTVKF